MGNQETWLNEIRQQEYDKRYIYLHPDEDPELDEPSREFKDYINRPVVRRDR